MKSMIFLGVLGLVQLEVHFVAVELDPRYLGRRTPQVLVVLVLDRVRSNGVALGGHRQRLLSIQATHTSPTLEKVGQKLINPACFAGFSHRVVS
jgi:hypothetical protein